MGVEVAISHIPLHHCQPPKPYQKTRTTKSVAYKVVATPPGWTVQRINFTPRAIITTEVACFIREQEAEAFARRLSKGRD